MTPTAHSTRPAPDLDAFRNLEDNGSHPFRCRYWDGAEGGWRFLQTKEGTPRKFSNLAEACEAGEAFRRGV